MDSVATRRLSFRRPKVDPSNWVAFASGPFGNHSVVFDRENRVRVEVWLDCGDRGRNKALFDELRADRQSIEQAVGAPIRWDRKDDKRAATLAVLGDRVPLGTDSSAEQYVTWTSTTVVAMLDALDHRLRQSALNLRDK